MAGLRREIRSAQSELGRMKAAAEAETRDRVGLIKELGSLSSRQEGHDVQSMSSCVPSTE